MAKRGKTPSLIGGGAGASCFVKAKRKRTCKRCGNSILKNNYCIEVRIPGSQGHKTYCRECYSNILGQSKKDLEKLQAKLSSLDES